MRQSVSPTSVLVDFQVTQHVLESDGRAFRAKVSLLRNAHEMQASLHITRCIASWTNAMVNIWCSHAQAR
jgi:hypothetical protein